MSPELEAALAKAREWEASASPEEIAAMWKAQRESWVRAFAPCEHGDYDWETCPECLSGYAKRRSATPETLPRGEFMTITGPSREAKIAKRRGNAIRRTGYPNRWPDEIAAEQKWRCAYCGGPMFKIGGGPQQRTLDHRLPISRGGKTQRKNLVAACADCNSRKGNLTEAEFLDKGEAE